MDKEKDNVEKNYIELLEEAQKKLPNIILPSMGMLENEDHIDINGNDYIKKSSE